MCINPKDIETTDTKKPQVFLKNITFNDGTKLSLNHNSVIVFTGANNSGKSQALRDIETGLDKSNYLKTIVIKDIEYDFLGNIDEVTFFSEHFSMNQDGFYEVLELGRNFDKSTILDYWQNHAFYNGLHLLFIKRLSTERRLTSSNALQRNDRPEQNSICKLNQSESLTQKLSDYFHQAFGSDLIVNRNDMRTIPLHIGQAPDRTAFTIANQDEYYNQVNKLPKLQDQGDGMRSFASILLDTFTSEYSITLIDEPEAFLHPPQARILGKMLAKNNPNDRQLLISTHSEDFLQGLLDANSDNVTVIRINRDSQINRMSVLQNHEIKELWSNPILRYSKILDGLFHEKVVVCESDYDCLFYQAIIDAVYEYKNEISPDILFTHCGGKTRIKDVVKALKAVNVPVVAICDFDLLNESRDFKPITASFGINWKEELSADMKIIYDSMNAKSSGENNAWKQIKKVGKAGFTGKEPAAYEKVEEVCKSAGLFVVPVGEMECFDKTINKEKKDWIYNLLEKYNLATEEKLEEARKFIQEIVDYKPF
ncbi:MAG: AAA family ATPase [Finegoldia magna]|uniref:ATP-dependent nuclease n=1 Tax=Finegoldia magna TaxID=1260 RepID=UPI00290A74A3|nr:AAA family ATPase [Finegoldia magna]MDU7479209.1 AAA family ATPase [Finegoldia magna]